MELQYGDIEIQIKETLGVGSYGKVCRGKYGKLPCAAKLLHDTLFQSGDPGIDNLTMRFHQECQFLSNIKHPNIVQYLGICRDPESDRPILLMELMDESLTKFLERDLAGPLPFHIQVNICHDVALALSYLHLNGIIHRDLSSNNVLLIGEGSRAKVTDFGMSKLIDLKRDSLTHCPGTQAYMPPEALATPPQYSNKIDCFSHGVLTIQVITRKFPGPGDATTVITDEKFPTGRAYVFIPEGIRRKKDIELVRADHPLLPIALHCLRDTETERPSADDLCQRLALFKKELSYTESVEMIKDQGATIALLRGVLEEREFQFFTELQRRTESYQVMDDEHKARLHSKEVQCQELKGELEEVKKKLELLQPSVPVSLIIMY